MTQLKKDQGEAAREVKNTGKQGKIDKKKLEKKVKALEKKLNSMNLNNNNSFNTAKQVHTQSSPSVSSASCKSKLPTTTN